MCVQAAGVASALSVELHTQPRVLGAAKLQAALRNSGAILGAKEMKLVAVATRCTPGGPPTPSASAVACDSVAAARTQWELRASDGSIRPAGNLTACLTAQPQSPEPTSHHGVAVVVATCREPVGAAQTWLTRSGLLLPSTGSGDGGNRANVTLQTALTPAPHCFGSYNHSSCGLLTALAWETTTEKSVMLWTTSDDATGHPQRWAISNGQISTEPAAGGAAGGAAAAAAAGEGVAAAGEGEGAAGGEGEGRGASGQVSKLLCLAHA